MAKRASVFGDEWRKCLTEHYKYVAKKQDKRTQTTLTPYMQRFGFGEDELKRLYIEATMRADEMPDDFVPDVQPTVLENVEDIKEQETSFQVHPAECSCPACMDTVLELGHDEEGQPLSEESLEEQAAQVEEKLSPKQKTMF